MANIIEAFPNGFNGAASFPEGGTTGQVLAKHSNADNDVEWKNIDVEKDTAPTENSTNAVQSGGVYTALAGKVDKELGKGLSTNDYTTEEKNRLANITIDIDNKVDKVTGKGLSTNDYTTEEKTKLAGLSNYDDTAIKGRVKAIEDVVPSTATAANKLATMEDVAGIATDYDTLDNRPQIAGTTLTGNKSLADLGIQASEEGKGLSANDYSNAEKEKVTNANSHLSAAVTDANGVHGFKVTTGNQTKILYKSGNDWVEIVLGDVTQSNNLPEAGAGNLGKIFQYTGTTTTTAPIYKHGYFYECVSKQESGETVYSWQNLTLMDVQEVQKSGLPQASEDEKGNIYQYVGTTNEDYVKGYYYECIKDGSEYKWVEKRVQSGGGQTIQYEVMPEASAGNEGNIYQYIGETSETAVGSFTNGYFYKCVAQGTDPETYAWEAQSVQEGGSGADSRIGEEITEIGVRKSGAVFTPYIKFLYELPSFDDLTWDEVIGFAQMYYDGDISLEEIKDAWNVGNSINMNLGAIGAYSDTTKINTTHSAQTVEMVIIDFNHDPLATAIGGKSNALITFQTRNCLNETAEWDLTYPTWQAWKDTARRDWCNTNVLSAIPSNIRNGIKVVSRPNFKTISTSSDAGQLENVSDSIFILTAYEIGGTDFSSEAHYPYPDGTQYAYYTTRSNRAKTINGSSGAYWTSKNNDGSNDSGNQLQTCIVPIGDVTTRGKDYKTYLTMPMGISFAFGI